MTLVLHEQSEVNILDEALKNLEQATSKQIWLLIHSGGRQDRIDQAKSKKELIIRLGAELQAMKAKPCEGPQS